MMMNTLKCLGLASLLYAGFSALGFAEIEEKLQQQYADNLIKEEPVDTLSNWPATIKQTTPSSEISELIMAEELNQIDKQIVSDDLETQRRNAIPLVMTKTAEDDEAGYFDGTNLSFSIQDGARIPEGLSEKSIGGLDRMIRIELNINKKKIVIQISPESNNLYIKGIDLATNQVTSLDLEEKTLVKKVMGHSFFPDEMSEEHKFYLSAALSLMAQYPENVPIFLWKDENEVIGVTSNQMAIRIPREQADLYNREAQVAIPFSANIMNRKMPSFDKSVKAGKGLAQGNLQPQRAAGISLCDYIGREREGYYSTSLLDCNPAFNPLIWTCKPFETVRFTHLVGGRGCFGRCGGGCHPGVGDVIGSLSQNYTQACHDHDHCVDHLWKAAPTCNGLFIYCMVDMFDEAMRCDKNPYMVDFKITSVEFNPTTVRAGAEISIRIEYELQNIVRVEPYQNLVKVYLDNRLLSSCNLTEPLGVWASRTCAGQVTIPRDASSGVLKVVIGESSITGVVEDRNIHNNTWTGQLTVIPNSHRLTVSKTGRGTVTSTPSGINCGSACAADFAAGTSVTLTASPAAGSTFGGWSGCASTSGNSCTVAMTQNRTVTANYITPTTYTLNVNSLGASEVAITSPTNATYGGTTNYTRSGIPDRTTITLIAPTTSGTANFSSWSGCGSPPGNTCTVMISQQDWTVTANYTPTTLTLREALDNPTLTWTTGGSADWYPQTEHSWFGGSAAASGTITDNEQSWIETAVTGPGTLRYYWRVSSESGYDLGYDFLSFYLNDVLQPEQISGEVEWTLREHSLPAGTHTLRWEYAKDGSVDYGSDRGWLDQVTFVPSAQTYTLNVNSSGATGVAITSSTSSTYSGTTHYTRSGIPSGTSITLTAPATAGTANFSHWSGCAWPSGNTCMVMISQQDWTVTANYTSTTLTLREALDNPTLIWTTGGSANWYPQTEHWMFGGSAAASGDTNNNQRSWIQTTVTGPGTLRYHWRVSSKSGYDFLSFYLNDVLQPEQISGEVEWTSREHSLPAGTHTLRWEYAKDDPDSAGGGRGWLDQVTFVPSAQTYTLNVNSAGASGVAITANPTTYGGATHYTRGGIPSGTNIDLTAPTTAPGGANFSSWNGCGSTSGNNCTVAMTQDRTVTANYTSGSCSELVLANRTVSGTETHASCRITTGPAFTITPTGQATFRAGQRITLRPGFRVRAGGRFRAAIDRGLASAAAAVDPYAPLAAASATDPAAAWPPATALTWSELPAGLQARLRERDATLRDAQQSADGAVIVFATETALVWNDDNAHSDLYRYDPHTDTLTLVSTSRAGRAADGPSHTPRLDGEGRHVLYLSTAGDLVAESGNQYTQIYHHDLRFGATTRLTRTAAGRPGAGDSGQPILADAWAIYQTEAPDLAPAGPGLYRQHLHDGRREAVGLDDWGIPDPRASHPTADAAGDQIAYQRPDPDDHRQIYLNDLWLVERLSRADDPTVGPLDHCCAALSADGRYLAYRERGAEGPAWLHLRDRARDRQVRLPWPADPALAEHAPAFRQDGDELWWIAPEQGPDWPEVLHRLANPLREPNTR